MLFEQGFETLLEQRVLRELEILEEDGVDVALLVGPYADVADIMGEVQAVRAVSVLRSLRNV